MNFKHLTQSEYIQCIRLLDRPNRSYPKISEVELQNYFFDDREDNYKVFGYYDKYGILNSVIFVEFSLVDRSYIIRYVAQQPFASLQDTFILLDYVLEYAESIRYYKFSIMYFEKTFLAYEKKLLSRSKKFLKYHSFTEEIIPPNRRSSFEKYWNHHQRRVGYPHTIYIREYILPDSYRKNEI